LAALIFFGMQSLADIAREEAERRKSLQQQGIEAKVIKSRSFPASTGGAFNKPESSSVKRPAATSSRDASTTKSSLRRYRSALQKLDRTIREEKARLELKRERLKKERWALPKTGRLSAGGRSEDARNRLREEIEELQLKIRQLRRERREIYDEGRREGFLPGELDGKGIIP